MVIPSQKGCKYKCNAFVSLPSFNGPLWELTFMHTFLIYLVIGCKIVSCEFVSCEFVSLEIVVMSLSDASFWLWNHPTSRVKGMIFRHLVASISESCSRRRSHFTEKKKLLRLKHLLFSIIFKDMKRVAYTAQMSTKAGAGVQWIGKLSIFKSPFI